jgi:hypothetical protein
VNERYFNIEALIRVQQVTWYVALIYFAVVFGLIMADIRWATALTAYGVGLILMATGLKLVVMAEQFRMAALRRFWILGYLLVLILIAIVILKYLI